MAFEAIKQGPLVVDQVIMEMTVEEEPQLVVAGDSRAVAIIITAGKNNHNDRPNHHHNSNHRYNRTIHLANSSVENSQHPTTTRDR